MRTGDTDRDGAGDRGEGVIQTTSSESGVQHDIDLERLRWALKHTGLGAS